MYFESVLTYSHNSHINVYNINLSKKINENSRFSASNVDSPLINPTELWKNTI